MAQSEVNGADLKELKQRMDYVVDADPRQYHDDFSLKRFLCAFKTVDLAFRAVLKTNKWRESYGVTALNNIELERKFSHKALVLRHRDHDGRPVIYIPVKNHNYVADNTDELTKHIVCCLEHAAGKCIEELIDNFCFIFDFKGLTPVSMNYKLIKNLIWLLTNHYPERVGVCLIYHAPTEFSSVWAEIRPLLRYETVAKVILVETEIQLGNHVIPALLPTDI